MLRATAAWLFFAVVYLFWRTYRFRSDGRAGVSAPKDGSKGYLLAVWHQNLFAGILAQTGRQHVVMVSRSRDGDFVSALCRHLGHYVARGSSRKGQIDKGGQQAKDEMITVLQSGVPGALTVDGPRGPAFEVKPGIIEMARVTGMPIVPYAPLPKRYWSFRSWDRFRLPKPFSCIDVHYGQPVHVPSDTAFDEFGRYQKQVADSLNALERAHGLGGSRLRSGVPATGGGQSR